MTHPLADAACHHAGPCVEPADWRLFDDRDAHQDRIAADLAADAAALALVGAEEQPW